MVAVKYFKTEGRTNELMYSINEGVDWKTVKFYKEPLKVRSRSSVRKNVNDILTTITNPF